MIFRHNVSHLCQEEASHRLCRCLYTAVVKDEESTFFDKITTQPRCFVVRETTVYSTSTIIFPVEIVRLDDCRIMSGHKNKRRFEEAGIVEFQCAPFDVHVGFNFGAFIEPLRQCVERRSIRPPVREGVSNACKTKYALDVSAFTDDASPGFPLR